MNKYAWVTLADNEDYLKEAVALATSLYKSHSKYPLILMIPYETIKKTVINEVQLQLTKLNCTIVTVPYIVNRFSLDYNNIVINKFHLLTFTHYDKLIFIDADYFIKENIDELFDMPFPLIQKSPESNYSKIILGGALIGLIPDLNFYSLILSFYCQYNFYTDEDCLNFLFNEHLFEFKSFIKDNYKDYIIHQGGYPKYWFTYPNVETIITTIMNKDNEDLSEILSNCTRRIDSSFNTQPLDNYLSTIIKRVGEKYE